jgi:hypothetical protein
VAGAVAIASVIALLAGRRCSRPYDTRVFSDRTSRGLRSRAVVGVVAALLPALRASRMNVLAAIAHE